MIFNLKIIHQSLYLNTKGKITMFIHTFLKEIQYLTEVRNITSKSEHTNNGIIQNSVPYTLFNIDLNSNQISI